MEILEIHLRRFKRFAELDISFSPGLNVVKGPNESGKSTLHEAIIVSLMERPTGKTREHEHLSWGQDRLYDLELSYRVPTGESYVIRKDFQARTHNIIGPNGDDHSRAGLNRALKDAIGTSSEKLFSSTACIRQDSMMDLGRGGKEISAQLQQIAMGGISGVNEIIERVEGKIKEFERGWKTNAPRNPGPIEQLNKRIREFEGLIQRITPEVTQRQQALDKLFENRERIDAIGRELTRLTELHSAHVMRQQLLESLEKHYQLERNLEEKIERVENAKRQEAQLQKTLNSQRHFYALDEQKERGLQTACANWKARLVEVKDREARISELEEERDVEQESTSEKNLPNTVAMILIGFVLGSFSALYNWPLDNNYRVALLITSAVITIAGLIWFLLPKIRRIRVSKKFDHLLKEARSRYESGLVELNSANRELMDLLVPFKCDSWDEFERNLASFRDWQTELEMIQAKLSVLLGKAHSRSDLETQRKEISRTRRDIQERLNELDQSPDLTAIEFQKVKGSIELLEEERQERQDQIIRLETISKSSSGTLQELHQSMERKADLEQEVAYILERYQVLQLTLHGLEVVRDQILKEAQDELEPRMGDYLDRLTKGRYLQADVDENLQIQVSLNSNNGRLVRVDELSSGTRDQVYFAARLALCDMIFQGANPPLLMDDPFIKFDAERRDAALRLCKDVAAERQLILFTCHDGYDAYADHVIDLGSTLPGKP